MSGKLSVIIVPVFRAKDDLMSFGSYRGIKLLKYAIKIIEKVLDR